LIEYYSIFRIPPSP